MSTGHLHTSPILEPFAATLAYFSGRSFNPEQQAVQRQENAAVATDLGAIGKATIAAIDHIK